MKQVTTIILLSLLINGQVQAQYNAELQVDYNTFNMRDLKKLQKVMFADQIVPMKTVSSFPGYIGFRGSFLRVVHTELEIEVGTVLSYTSTGGRVQYKDYSGELTGDQLTHVFTVGVLGRIPLYKTEKIKFGFSLYSGIEATTMKLHNYVRINNERSSSRDKFGAVGIGAVPSLYMKYYVNDKLYLLADAGYHFTLFQNTYRWSENENAEIFLEEGDDEALKPNWNGLRMGVGVGYTFDF